MSAVTQNGPLSGDITALKTTIWKSSQVTTEERRLKGYPAYSYMFGNVIMSMVRYNDQLHLHVYKGFDLIL